MGFLSSKQVDGAGRKQQINAYNVLILILLAPASFTYGYTAAIIATTLGIYLSNTSTPANIVRILKAQAVH